MKNVFLSLLLGLNLVVVTAQANHTSISEVAVPLSNCAGELQLTNKSNQEMNWSIQSDRCKTVKFFDSLSGKILNEYTIATKTSATFPMAQEQVDSLLRNCKLGVQVTRNYYGAELFQDNFTLVVPEICNYNKRIATIVELIAQITNLSRYQPDVITYEWSKQKNCKKLYNNVYRNENVDKKYCYAFAK